MNMRKWFTLIEMLIVIVIIGILSAALIPKIIWVQARARDTARTADTRNLANAIETYAFDNGGTYPIASFWDASNSSGNIWSLSWILSSYISNIPTDKNHGLVTTINGDCYQMGDYFAYYTDDIGSRYAITSLKESKIGNATNCRGISISSPVWNYETYGQWIISWSFIPDNQLSLWGRYWIAIMSYSWPSWPIVLSNETSKFTNMVINAFNSKWLTYVFIPNGIVRLWWNVFLNNKLTSIIIPKTVTYLGWNDFLANWPNSNSQTLPFTGNDGTDQVWILNWTTWQRKR